MATLKCKMCGGSLELIPDENICECEFCGTRQTVPTADNEKKITLFDRANRLRMKSEFDKAASVYESIVNEFPEEAEAYWGLCLCKYGIEYVDDPATGKKVPTCHRTSFDGIFKDTNFELAQEYSDGITRSMYREEAKEIDRLQKAILEIAQKEEPFDIFICYKETDENGNRTKDSVRAQEIYNELTKEGYKVFFSRITLEDKLGEAYEPYIFSALHSSKIMLAIGTSYDNYNAVWVKNEWSRFLQMMKDDSSKKLIPCYSDIDAYDMPEEFSNLQGQDMAKIGFLQDLLRGIDKLFGKGNEAIVRNTVSDTSSRSILDAQVAALLKRGFLSLEDGEFSRADEFFEQALNNDAENAEAYLGKLMAELQVSKQEELKNCKESFNDRKNYQRAIRFGDEQLIQLLESYNQHIRDRSKQQQMEMQYKKAASIMNRASGVKDYEEAIEAFQDIADYKDSSKNIDICRKKIKEIKEKEAEDRKEAIYKNAISIMKRTRSAKDYQDTLHLLQSIPSYKDADELAAICSQKTQELLKKEEAERIEAEKKVDAVIAALEKHILQEKGGSLQDQLKTQEKNLMELKQQTEVLPGLVKEKAEKEQELSIIKKTISELQSKRHSLGLFARKEKAAIDAQLLQLSDEQNKLVKVTADIEKKINGSSNESQLEIEIRECQEEIAKLRTAIQREGSISEMSYEEALKCTGSPAMRIEIGKRKPELANMTEEIEFGNYHGKIVWKVIDRNGNKLLMLSKYGLDTIPYNEDGTDTTWEKSTLRKWLNDTFLKESFSEEEQKQIINTNVIADKNPKHSTDPGDDTEDRVFLLSIPEVNLYLNSEEARMCAPTDYAKMKGAYVNDKRKTMEGKAIYSWWLRSPGDDVVFAALVDSNGVIDMSGILVNYGFLCIRPAIWVDLEKF